MIEWRDTIHEITRSTRSHTKKKCIIYAISVLVKFGFRNVLFTPRLEPGGKYAALEVVNRFNGFSCLLLSEAVETANQIEAGPITGLKAAV